MTKIKMPTKKTLFAMHEEELVVVVLDMIVYTVMSMQVVVSTRSQGYLVSLMMRVMTAMRITAVPITVVDTARKITKS